jgi:hypothetical protein
VLPARNPASGFRQPTGDDGVFEGFAHLNGVLGTGDGRGQQHRVTAQLHGQGCIRGRADARVEHHRDGRPGNDELNVVWVKDP